MLRVVLEVDECLQCQSGRPPPPLAHTQFKSDGKQVKDGLRRLKRYSSYVSSSDTEVLKLITDRNLFSLAFAISIHHVQPLGGVQVNGLWSRGWWVGFKKKKGKEIDANVRFSDLKLNSSFSMYALPMWLHRL